MQLCFIRFMRPPKLYVFQATTKQIFIWSWWFVVIFSGTYWVPSEVSDSFCKQQISCYQCFCVFLMKSNGDGEIIVKQIPFLFMCFPANKGLCYA